MEEEVKISFWKKLKISIFGLEEYQKLIVQKTRKTIFYVIILMLIFAFFLSFALTYKFSQKVTEVKKYIEENIETLEFDNGKLLISGKESNVIQTDKLYDGKIIIDTEENISNEKLEKYKDDIKSYYNGIIILRDTVMIRSITGTFTTISLEEVSDKFNLVKLNKQDIISVFSSNNVYSIYISFYIVMFVYMFIIYLSTTLLDAILYSFLGYITGISVNLRIRYKNVYNVAIYSMTLPIILNLIYMIVNILTGYTIKYFSILYMAITCIYVIAAILIIRSEIIKKQIELSKILEEQEKVRQEIEEKERQKKEEEEKEKIRKKDEKERQEQKKKKQENKKTPKAGENPEPQANIKTEEF